MAIYLKADGLIILSNYELVGHWISRPDGDMIHPVARTCYIHGLVVICGLKLQMDMEFF